MADGTWTYPFGDVNSAVSNGKSDCPSSVLAVSNGTWRFTFSVNKKLKIMVIMKWEMGNGKWEMLSGSSGMLIYYQNDACSSISRCYYLQEVFV